MKNDLKRARKLVGKAAIFLYSDIQKIKINYFEPAKIKRNGKNRTQNFFLIYSENDLTRQQTSHQKKKSI